MPSADEYWRSIRAQRAAPPGFADADAERRLVFQSALAQAEELWEAASVAGPKSRALPLFYALSQAGRAICAAWSNRGEWQPQSHGLSGRESTSASFVADYGCSVSGGDRGAFGMIAEATGSPVLTDTATTAQLWASLPRFPTQSEFIGSGVQCIYLDAFSVPTTTPGISTATTYLVDLLRPTHARVRSGEAGVSALFAPFAAADGYEVVGGWGMTSGLPGGSGDIVAFPDPAGDGSFRPLSEVADRLPTDGSGPLFEQRTFVLRPPVGSGRNPPPTVLMTLWALLFNLSQLTRYYPAQWVGALDPDESPIAVTLEHGLDLALEMSPRLIAEGLSGPRLLLQ